MVTELRDFLPKPQANDRHYFIFNSLQIKSKMYEYTDKRLLKSEFTEILTALVIGADDANKANRLLV